MRLTPEYQQTITEKFKKIFNMNAHLYLFGSRVFDHKKGGDIDLLIITDTDQEKEQALDQRLDFLVSLKMNLGDQKIDCLILSKTELDTHVFYQVIKDEKLLLVLNIF